ncbi:hypothetical protein BBJ28_00021786, partial [Nothophytophthora sp. Chile5]
MAAQDIPSIATNAIAVISFVTGATSYGEVIQYENSLGVSKTFNFQICNGGTNCNGVFENCIQLPEAVDLFMYNPFTVTRLLECPNLAGGVPVTHVDAQGVRQCFCGCPSGYEQQTSTSGSEECVKVVEETCECVWAEMNGFPITVTTPLAVCSFTDLATDFGLPVPFPTDGYVSDLRTTITEGTMDPRITLTADRLDSKGDVSVFDDEGTWKAYQTNRVDVIDSLAFTSYGEYALEMKAYDYFSSATCDGCVTIVDSYRPKATTSCPSSFCDYVSKTTGCHPATVELTTANMATADDLADDFLDFHGLAKNDACSESRCDVKTLDKRDFYESGYSSVAYSGVSTCFDKNTVWDDFLCKAKSKVNPLAVSADACDNTDHPVPAGQCTRCCKMHTELKEWWTDYKCGVDSPTRTCSGDADQTCDLEQCLLMNGDTLATVTAAINQDVQTESQSVLSHVEQEGYQTVTQVHHALDCTSFGGDDGTCDFSAKLSELIDTTQQLAVNPGSHGAVGDYVHWRYKVAGESWELWKTGSDVVYGATVYEHDDVLTFTSPETKITIEAWTQC